MPDQHCRKSQNETRFKTKEAETYQTDIVIWPLFAMTKPAVSKVLFQTVLCL